MGNLSQLATVDDVQHAFAYFGKVSNVTIVMDDETGDPRGFALVDMAVDKEAATAVRQRSHCQFHGQSLTVHKSTFHGGRPCRGND